MSRDAVLEQSETGNSPADFQHTGSSGLFSSSSSSSSRSPDAQLSAQEFSYRPVSILAIVGLILGLATITALGFLFGLLLAPIALGVSLLALIRISRSRGALGGLIPATLGFTMSLAFAAWGGYVNYKVWKVEAPEKFTRLSFSSDISAKNFIVNDGRSDIHPDVQKLVGKPIFLKGYMYPTEETEGLRQFLLLKDTGQCCFGGKPALTDMIGVKIVAGPPVDHQKGRVGVGGVFQINPRYNGSNPLEPLYVLEGSYFTSRLSVF